MTTTTESLTSEAADNAVHLETDDTHHVTEVQPEMEVDKSMAHTVETKGDTEGGTRRGQRPTTVNTKDEMTAENAVNNTVTERREYQQRQ